MASVGIDIGTQSIKVAVLDGSAKAPRVTAFYHHRLESGHTTRSLGVDDLSDLVRSLLERWGVDGVSAYASTPCASALIRELTVPFVKTEQIKKTLKFQAESVFHAVSIDDMVVDHVKLAEYGGEKSRLLVMAVRKELLKERLSALEQAGIDPPAVDLDAAAIYTLGTLLPAAKEGKRVLLVDLGGATVKMVALEGGLLRGLRATRLQTSGMKVGAKKEEAPKKKGPAQLSLSDVKSGEDTFFAGGEDDGKLPVVILDEEQSELFDFLEAPEEERRDVLEKVFLEIDRTLASTRLEGPIDQVYVTGGGAGVEGIEAAFAERFGAPCERLSVKAGVPAAKLPKDAGQELDLYGAVAVGLALKGLGHDPSGLDFRQEDLAYQGKFDKAKRGVACALVLLFVVFFLVAYDYQINELGRLGRQQDRALRYQREVYMTLFPEDQAKQIPNENYLEAARKKKKDLERRVKGFDVPDVYSALDMLRDVAQGFEESGKKCLLKELSLKQKSSMLRVEMDNELVAYDLKNAVNAKPRLVELEEGRVTPDAKTGKVLAEFRVNIRATPKKKPAGAAGAAAGDGAEGKAPADGAEGTGG